MIVHAAHIATEITYAYYVQAWEAQQAYLRALVLEKKLRRICEIGGGANPGLPVSFVREHNLDYTVLDVSAEELAKAPAGYTKVHADIMDPAGLGTRSAHNFNVVGRLAGLMQPSPESSYLRMVRYQVASQTVGN